MVMTWLDSVAKVAPGWAANYAAKSRRYDVQKNSAEAQRLYQAATSTQYRKTLTGQGLSPDAINAKASTRLREMARHLEENHDLTNAVFDDLLNNTIGAGAAKAPMVRLTNGELSTDLNKRICEVFDDWSQSPDTTGEFGF
ncbi:MAG: phage portal protein, partial [Pseudomonadales bacterium]